MMVVAEASCSEDPVHREMKWKKGPSLSPDSLKPNRCPYILFVIRAAYLCSMRLAIPKQMEKEEDLKRVA
jgi:hypothetical protein